MYHDSHAFFSKIHKHFDALLITYTHSSRYESINYLFLRLYHTSETKWKRNDWSAKSRDFSRMENDKQTPKYWAFLENCCRLRKYHYCGQFNVRKKIEHNWRNIKLKLGKRNSLLIRTKNDCICKCKWITTLKSGL